MSSILAHQLRESGFDFFQAEDGIRDVERSRGLGDVYKRQIYYIHVYIPRQIYYFFMGEWKLFGLTKSVCVANVILSEWCPVTFDQIENNMIKKNN